MITVDFFFCMNLKNDSYHYYIMTVIYAGTKLVCYHTRNINIRPYELFYVYNDDFVIIHPQDEIVSMSLCILKYTIDINQYSDNMYLPNLDTILCSSYVTLDNRGNRVYILYKNDVRYYKTVQTIYTTGAELYKNNPFRLKKSNKSCWNYNIIRDVLVACIVLFAFLFLR